MGAPLGTLSNAGRVLDLFSSARPEWRLTDVACALGLSKAGAHDLLDSLVEISLLDRTSRRRYRLGPRVAALHRVFLRGAGIDPAVIRCVDRLADETGETVHLALREQAGAICVDAAHGMNSCGGEGPQIGERLSSRLALGRILWAEFGESELRSVLAPPAHVDSDELRHELSAVRASGIAVDWDASRCMIAAPIRNHAGDVVAALSISGPRSRFGISRPRYALSLGRAASGISRVMGYRAGLGRQPLRLVS